MKKLNGIKLLVLLDFLDEEENFELNEVLGASNLINGHLKYMNKQPKRNSFLTGHAYTLEIIHGHEERCFEMFRMAPKDLIDLTDLLKKKTDLKDSRFISAVEQVAIFMYVISHTEKNRVVAERFQHSGETISHYFNDVLKRLCKLGTKLIAPPNQQIVPEEIKRNSKYSPFFKDCIGAIDGTHIDACVPSDQQIPYRGKKVDTTQNIMCACDFNMCFTYVISGWEGTANDSRIILETITNTDNGFPMPNQGKYYVVDSGYTNLPGFLAPYRGERYHLPDFDARGPPKKIEELFNYHHSSLRNVIERCFGVLKARFPILSNMPPYSVKTQKYIPIACCTVHNFIRQRNMDDRLFLEYSDPNMRFAHDISEDNPIEHNISQSQVRLMATLRDNIAKNLWETFGH